MIFRASKSIYPVCCIEALKERRLETKINDDRSEGLYSPIRTHGKRGLDGSVIRLSKKCAEIIFDKQIEILKNLKMNLRDVDDNLAPKCF